MSYLALARKWRPHQFDQVVGQSHVLTALENALAQNRLHHAYLFSGTRGVGKTTIGRLFAKGLNCETGITATPCGKCDTCREIDEGRFVDLLEIDAASRTKVEDTRELLDNVQYKPARGRFKVYLIDEVHMLSRHSFNALLKTLEEPPEYVKFLLATTDPQKLPVTILSRCLQFHLKPISVDDIHQQLDYVLDQESIEKEARAVGLISYAADGSMRDALSLTDQAIALGNGKVEFDSVSHMLGSIDTDQALHLLEAIATKNAQTAIDKIQELATNGVDWDSLLQELSTQLHKVAMCQALPASLDHSAPDADHIERLAKSLSPQDVQMCYQIALKGREDIALAPNGRIGLEMIVLRMIAFRPAAAVQGNAISTQSAAAQPVQQTQPAMVQQAPKLQQAPVQSAPQQPVHQPASAPQYQSAPQYDAPPHMAPPEQYAPPPSYGNESMPQHAPQHQAVPQNTAPQQQEPAPESRPSPISGLRHQLRSQRKGGQSGNAGSAPTKKSNATSAKKESVIDRLAQKHPTSGSVSRTSQTASEPDLSNEPYQWRPSQPVVEKKNSELTPTQLKRALEHEKTPEMVKKLADEAIERDEWSRLINQLDTPKLVEQLALNSSFEQDGQSILLTLRQHQSHLNTDRAQGALVAALSETLGQDCTLSIEVGDKGETPLELRDKLYQDRLQQAVVSLESDPHVQFIERRFMAELDKDSIRPI